MTVRRIDRPTQKTRIAMQLVMSEDGFVVTDFAAPRVVDGGAPILRVAARIHDLRRDGWEIDEVPVGRSRVARYRLPFWPFHNEYAAKALLRRALREAA